MMNDFFSRARMLLVAGGIVSAVVVLSATAAVGLTQLGGEPAQRLEGVALAQASTPLPEPAAAFCGGSIAEDDAGSGGCELALQASSAQTNPTPPPTPPACGGSIDYGLAVQGSLLGTAARCDYTFQGAAGDLVTIRLVAVDGNLDPVLRLVDANGTVLAENDDADGRNSEVSEFRLPGAGTYVLQAMSYQGQSSGRYQLTLEKQSPTPTAPHVLIPPGCGGSLQANQVRSGAITAVDTECSYSYSGRTGKVVTIRMDKTQGSSASPNDLDPIVTLNPPSGSGKPPVSNDDAYGRNSLIWRYRLSVTGRYEIVASSYGGTTGGFDILLMEDGFHRGDRVQQIYSPAVNIRRAPGSVNKPAGDILGNVPVGTLLDVVGGPRVVDALTWWQVQYWNTAGGQVTGWVAEARATGQPILAPAY